MLHDILPENPGINMQYRFDADIFNTGDSPFPSELPSLNLNRGVNPKRNVAPENAALESFVPCSLFHVLTALVNSGTLPLNQYESDTVLKPAYLNLLIHMISGERK